MRAVMAREPQNDHYRGVRTVAQWHLRSRPVTFRNAHHDGRAGGAARVQSHALTMRLRSFRAWMSSRKPPMIETTELQAATFRRLLKHLNENRTDVQNIDLMILAGFCRNCLADWYRDAADERLLDLSKDEARAAIYGMPFEEWKAKYQKQATPEQLAAFEAAQQARK
jgi:hypothetical protein